MSSSRRVKTTTAVYSDVGKVRTANEDSYYISRDENLLVVCDGMGGQVAGGLASKMAVETIKDVYQSMSGKDVLTFLYDEERKLTSGSQRLVAAVRLANRRIYNISAKFSKLRGMGTTVVALALDSSFATMVHVGDSRIFRYSDRKILQLTEDHSWLNELIEDNEINEEQIETFSQKNVITRALGTSPTIRIDIHSEKYRKNDLYVLCTDGMHGTVGAKDIKKVVERSKGSIDRIARTLIEAAVRRDGSDNVTVAVARIEQNSREMGVAAVSTTIPEEGARITVVEEKFIQEQYPEPKMRGKNPMNIAMNSKSIFMPILVVLTAMLCFMLGLLLKEGRFSSNKAASMGVSGSQLQRGLAAQQLRGRDSADSGGVIAVVMFKNQAELDQARLTEKGRLLNQFKLYDDDGQPIVKDTFSIFLINDATGDVLEKTSGIKLPRLQTN